MGVLSRDESYSCSSAVLTSEGVLVGISTGLLCLDLHTQPLRVDAMAKLQKCAQV